MEKETGILKTIKKLLKMEGLRQNVLAEKLGTNQSSLSQMINGHTRITWDAAERILTFLGWEIVIQRRISNNTTDSNDFKIIESNDQQ